MFQIKFSNTFDKSSYIKHKMQPVVEDYYKIDGQIFCVADGITQDLTDGTTTGYPENKEDIEKILEKYPNPSGTYLAAKIFCEKCVKYIKEKLVEVNMTEDILLEIIKKANRDIWEINKGRNINYITEDIYGCEAAGGVIAGNFLFCFNVGDCHITLLDKEYNKVFDTLSNDKFIKYEQTHLKQLNFKWTNPEYRYLIRRFFRNNSGLKENGEDITYGMLSGEEEAEYYINIYKVDLSNVKYITVYSDGCEPNFKNKEEIKKLINETDSIQYSGNEKTLIIYEKKEKS